MKTIQKFVVNSVTTAMLIGLVGCTDMSTEVRNTAIDAGVDAVGGAAFTGSNGLGTVGGAAVGGIIGHEISKANR